MCIGVCVSVMNAPFLTIVLIWTSSLSIKIYYYLLFIFIFKLTDCIHGPDIASVEINKYPQINVFFTLQT